MKKQDKYSYMTPAEQEARHRLMIDRMTTVSLTCSIAAIAISVLRILFALFSA